MKMKVPRISVSLNDIVGHSVSEHKLLLHINHSTYITVI